MRFGAPRFPAARVRALGLLAVFLGPAAFAADAEPRTVVIMSEPKAEAASQRLRQEIEALGFRVEVKPETTPVRSLEAVAEEAHALAAIRVQPLHAGGVEMTVLDRVTGKTVHRELGGASESDLAGDELVATRTVELFRASLMELSADHPARGDVPAAPPVRALVRHDQEQASRNAGSVSLALGPALLIMPDFRPSTQLWLSASWLSSSGFGVRGAAMTSLSPAHVEGPEGAVDLTSRSYRLGVTWAYRPHTSRWSAQLSAGWSLTTLSLSGTASPPYVASQADHLAWGPWLGAGGQLRLFEHLGLVAELSGALSVPNQTIRFAGREVADFARPGFVAALGPELSWP